MSKKISLDRIEGNFAIGEDDRGNKVEIPLNRLPEGAGPPHVLDETNGVLTIDHDETEKRKAGTAELLDRLFEDANNPGEDSGK